MPNSLPTAGALQRDGVTYLPRVLSEDDCRLILNSLNAVSVGELDTAELNLRDSPDVANMIYESRRSPALRYCYLRSDSVMNLSTRVAQELSRLLGINFESNINMHCLPAFMYSEGGYIEPHRGRDIGYGGNEFVGVCMVTEPGVDFEEGRFFLNATGRASRDGKTIFFEDKSYRQYFNIGRGDILVFHNPTMIHGTEAVTRSSSGSAYRVTVSWRTEHRKGSKCQLRK